RRVETALRLRLAARGDRRPHARASTLAVGLVRLIVLLEQVDDVAAAVDQHRLAEVRALRGGEDRSAALGGARRRARARRGAALVAAGAAPAASEGGDRRHPGREEDPRSRRFAQLGSLRRLWPGRAPARPGGIRPGEPPGSRGPGAADGQPAGRVGPEAQPFLQTMKPTALTGKPGALVRRL